MWVCVFTLLSVLAVTFGQRVAPGVPPQQYNPNHQVPAHQHVPPHQQVPQHQQQQYQAPHGHVPQMQQVPLQQQQQHGQPPPQHHQQQQQQQHHQQHQQMGQQPQHGQIPVEHGGHHAGHHGGGHNPQQLLNVANMMQEKDHIQEHMEVPMDTSKMSEQELQFHYFKMHDADNNNKLDGCELIKSLIHWHDPPEGTDTGEANPQFQTDEQFESQVDPILKEHDLNNDGYIDYVEFRKAESVQK